MHCIRRAALRAALSASRQAAPKAIAAPSVAISALKMTASVQTPSLVSRCFSQTARVREEDQQEGQRQQTQPPDNGLTFVGVETEHGVFVRNMAFSVTTEQVKAAFEKFGTVAGCQVARDARGMSRGYGFVYFETAEAKDAAIAEVDGSFWHGRRINVLERTANKNLRDQDTTPSDVLFVGNIPYDTTDAELTRIFRELPNIQDIRVAVDRTTGWPRGFAHLTFTSVEAADAARVKLAETVIRGRQLRCNFSFGKSASNSESNDFKRGEE